VVVVVVVVVVAVVVVVVVGGGWKVDRRFGSVVTINTVKAVETLVVVMVVVVAAAAAAAAAVVVVVVVIPFDIPVVQLAHPWWYQMPCSKSGHHGCQSQTIDDGGVSFPPGNEYISTLPSLNYHNYYLSIQVDDAVGKDGMLFPHDCHREGNKGEKKGENTAGACFPWLWLVL